MGPNYDPKEILLFIMRKENRASTYDLVHITDFSLTGKAAPHECVIRTSQS